jgi:hypothetical protein
LVFIVSATDHSDCLSFIAFSFEKEAPKEKALQKEKGVFSPTRRATAFEKAVQNNPFGSREQRVQPFDKSKFEKIYKKVFSSIDNFLNLCYTNMNYCVKMRRLGLYWSIGAGKGR